MKTIRRIGPIGLIAWAALAASCRAQKQEMLSPADRQKARMVLDRAAAVEAATNNLNTRVTATEAATNNLNTRVTDTEAATNNLNTRVTATEAATNALNGYANSVALATNAHDAAIIALNNATNLLNSGMTSMAAATNDIRLVYSTATNDANTRVGTVEGVHSAATYTFTNVCGTNTFIVINGHISAIN